jgi:hydroxyethylthiazole kinase-like uncharacterized protein yjeF
MRASNSPPTLINQQKRWLVRNSMIISADHQTNPVYFTAEVREIERLAAALPEAPQLMEKAGFAAAEIARDKLLIHGRTKVLVLAGPGNNGGDAFVAARYLRLWQYDSTLVFAGNRHDLSNDAQRALDRWVASGGEVVETIPSAEEWDAVIDGLFGIGLDQRAGRDLAEKYLALVNAVNAMKVPVLALDVPSGLGSDTGTVCGAAIRAMITVTFIALKPGLLTNKGPEHCGQIFVRSLGLDVVALKTPGSWAVDHAHVAKLLPAPRPADSHKGMFGSIGIIGGSTGMIGAALLAATAALKLGAGRVYVGLLASNTIGVDLTQPELMLRPAHALFQTGHLNCIVIGPGLGSDPDARFWVVCALKSTLPLVLDADALNLVAASPAMGSLLRTRKIPSVLTPHPAEAARLLGVGTDAIQQDRMATAQALAEKFNCCVVLKGAGSICATPDGKCYINTSGNPGLSSAGTGDILAGMIGAMMAQSASQEDSMLLSVYLHGAAADALEKEHGGPVGMTASEIPDAARCLLNRWIYKA